MTFMRMGIVMKLVLGVFVLQGMLVCSHGNQQGNWQSAKDYVQRVVGNAYAGGNKQAEAAGKITADSIDTKTMVDEGKSWTDWARKNFISFSNSASKQGDDAAKTASQKAEPAKDSIFSKASDLESTADDAKDKGKSWIEWARKKFSSTSKQGEDAAVTAGINAKDSVASKASDASNLASDVADSTYKQASQRGDDAAEIIKTGQKVLNEKGDDMQGTANSMYGTLKGYTDAVKSYARGILGSSKMQAENAGDEFQKNADSAFKSAADATHDTAGKAKQLGADLYDETAETAKSGRTSHETKDAAGVVQEKAGDAYAKARDIAGSRVDNSDNTYKKAQDVVRSGVDKVQSVASDTYDKAKERGSTVGSAVETGIDRAERAASDAYDKSRWKGSSAGSNAAESIEDAGDGALKQAKSKADAVNENLKEVASSGSHIEL